MALKMTEHGPLTLHYDEIRLLKHRTRLGFRLDCNIDSCKINVTLGGTPCNGLYGEAQPKRGTFFQAYGI